MFKFEPKNIDDIAKIIKGILPESPKASIDELKKTLRSGAEGVLQKLDLVTREEYDVQVALLKKCQTKISELEEKIVSLEENK